MKKFLLKSTLFLALFSGALVALSFVPRPPFEATDYMQAIIDKHARANSIGGQKIVLAGGSNLAFGIDSERIEAEFGVPVVNLGLHGGLGLDFFLAEAADVAKPGDVVLLSIEYFMDVPGNFELKELTTKDFPAARKYYRRFGYEHLSSFLDKQHKTFRQLFESVEIEPLNPVYARDAFNTQGDVIKHLDAPKPDGIRGIRRKMRRENWPGIREINKFAKRAEANGVRVYFLYPNLARTVFDNNAEVIGWLHGVLQKDLAAPILNRPEDFVYDDSLCFDTVYHLTAAGRKLRTEKLITLMRNSEVAGLLIGSPPK